jgi:peroxiredoxin
MPDVDPATRTWSTVGQFAFVLLAAGLVYTFVAVTREGELRRRCSAACALHPSYMGSDRKAPSFTLTDSKGKSVKLDDYRGKVVFLNFWTTTCGPCREEMPTIAELTNIVSDRKDVAVVTVSIDDDVSQAMNVLHGLLNADPPFTVLFDPDAKTVRGKFGTTLYPETWIIDKRGVIRARFDGAKEWSDSTVVELIDDLRHDGYCPVDVGAKGGEVQMSGEAAKLCEAPSAG